MAISVNPQTFVITVPKADLTLVQATPTEIYNLDVNSFRLWLKDWEDNGSPANDAGITFPVTHLHYPEVTLGGLTFARVINILAPYTITFEDGQYAVNLIGGNTNIGDKTNVNQVSVRPQNSAGLISTPLIEYSSFEGGVWYNDSVGHSGTLFPVGTPLKPSNDLTAVRTIADFRGFNIVNVMNDAVLGTGNDFQHFVFRGQNHIANRVFIETTALVHGCVFQNLTVQGVLDGENEISHCVVDDVDYVNGHVHDCGLLGEITLAGNLDGVFVNCNTIDPYDPPIINMGGVGQNLIMPNYSGLLWIKNMTGDSFVGVGLLSGQCILDSATITSGTVHVSGNGQLIDENGTTIKSGTWNGGVNVINEAVSQSSIDSSILNYTNQTNSMVGGSQVRMDAGFRRLENITAAGNLAKE